jgi:hypothetical protein
VYLALRLLNRVLDLDRAGALNLYTQLREGSAHRRRIHDPDDLHYTSSEMSPGRFWLPKLAGIRAVSVWYTQ